MLLILAGISIVMLTGDNSILKNAQRAKIETARAELEEKVKIAIAGAYDSNGEFSDENFKKELENLGIKYDVVDDEIDVEMPDGKHMVISTETGNTRYTEEKLTLTYTLRFNGNGGTGIIEDVVLNLNEERALPENAFEKEGYIFSGWSKQPNGEKVYDPCEVVKNVTSKKSDIVNLYAVWTASTYGITYELNGGKLETENPTYATYDAEVVVSNPTKVGYEFAGWTITEMTKSSHKIGTTTSSEETVTGTKETSFMNLRNEVGTVTFTAVWTANTGTKYTVEHYQMNTSGNYSGVEAVTQNLTGTSDASIILANLQQSYTGFQYSYGQVNGKTETSTTISSDGSRIIKLYYTRNQYTLNFNGNGGSVYPTQITTGYGAGISMPTPARAGHTFNGWWTAASGGSQVNYTTMPLNGGTVYAHWTYVPQGLEGQALSVGREVTLGGEQFFVIEDSPASNGNVKLLSKFNLNTAGTAQQNAAYGTTACKFSDSKYWTGNSENLNNNNAPAESAYQKAKAYGAAKGGTGRLMTYDEANALKSANSNILYGKNIGASDGYLHYWLGTSYSSNGSYGIVWYVNGDYGDLSHDIFSISGNRGVRVVIEVSKSKVS